MKFYKINNDVVFSKEDIIGAQDVMANVVDASHEKHLPVYEVNGDKIKVRVGEIDHPMEEAHYIMWIMLEYNNEVIIHYLNPMDTPSCEFPYLKNSTIYAYCNLHGLWKTIVL